MKAHVIILLFVFQCAYCQINERITAASKGNQENRKSQNDVTYHSYINDDCIDEKIVEINIVECISSCILLGNLVDAIVNGLSYEDYKIRQRDTSIVRIGSQTIDFCTGNITPNSTTIVSQVKINGALFSTDIRIFSNYEKHLDEDLHYYTLDWQMLMFNLLVQKEINFSIGTGVMHENVSNILFNEHTLLLDIYPFRFLDASCEYRVTPDYKTDVIVRQELNVGLGLKIYEQEKFSIKLRGTYQTAIYYEDVNYNVFCFGFAFDLY